MFLHGEKGWFCNSEVDESEIVQMIYESKDHYNLTFREGLWSLWCRSNMMSLDTGKENCSVIDSSEK